MKWHQLYVEKTSDTSADTLLAVGLASLIKEVLRQNGKPTKGIIVQDAGPYYHVRTPIPITANDLQNLEPFAIIKPLVTDKYIDKQEKKGLKLDGFDYQRQKEIRKSYLEKLRKLPTE